LFGKNPAAGGLQTQRWFAFKQLVNATIKARLCFDSFQTNPAAGGIASSTLKHCRAFAFARLKVGGQIQATLSRVVVDCFHSIGIIICDLS